MLTPKCPRHNFFVSQNSDTLPHTRMYILTKNESPNASKFLTPETDYDAPPQRLIIPCQSAINIIAIGAVPRTPWYCPPLILILIVVFALTNICRSLLLLCNLLHPPQNTMDPMNPPSPRQIHSANRRANR